MGILDFLRRGKESTQIQLWKEEINNLTTERNGLRQDVERIREDVNAKVISLNSMKNSLDHAQIILKEYKTENSILRTRLNTLEEIGIKSREGTVKKIMEDNREIGYNEAKILGIMYNSPNVRLKSSDIRKELGVSRATAYKVIHNLMDSNKVERLGSENKTFIMLRHELVELYKKQKTPFVGQRKEVEEETEDEFKQEY